MTAAATIPGPAPDLTADSETATAVETLFKYSEWVHRGEGAAECEHAEDGQCKTATHFHAWCRMPNQLQHEDIREKAFAAKGRRVRQLRDPSSDAHDALEAALDTLAAAGDEVKEEIVADLLAHQRYIDYSEAATDVVEKEDGVVEVDGEEEKVLPYEHIAQDRERLQELEALAPSERPADEYAELRKHCDAFEDEVEKAFAGHHEPRVAEMMSRDISALIDLIRESRIRAEADREFMKTYSSWEWLWCTLTFPGGPQRFADMAALRDVSPEVYEALRATFDGLERAQTEVSSGN